MAYTDRKKTKKFDKMSWAQKEHYREQQMKKYGLDRIDNGEEIIGRGGYDEEAEEAAILLAMNNDYDIRESMKYGRNAGNKYFDDFESNGFKTLNDATLGARAIEKYGMNVLGDDVVGKKVKGRDDYAAVSDSLFNASRDNFSSSFNKDDLDDEQTNTAITPDEPYEPSPELLKQQGILADWEKGYGPGGNLSPYKSNFQDIAYDSEEANPYRPTTDVNEFARQYKDGVKNVFQFRPTIL